MFIMNIVHCFSGHVFGNLKSSYSLELSVSGAQLDRNIDSPLYSTLSLVSLTKFDVQLISKLIIQMYTQHTL